MNIDVLIEVLTGASWLMYSVLVFIGLPGMYNSIWEFIMDDDLALAVFAFSLPVFFCLGWGVAVYYFPLCTGALMSYFITETLRNR